MIGNRKVVVVLPAYNAEQTVERSYREIPHRRAIYRWDLLEPRQAR